MNTKTRFFFFVDVGKIFIGRVCENCFVHCCMVVIPDTLFYQFNVFIIFFFLAVYRLTVSRRYLDTGSAAVAGSLSRFAMLRQQINYTLHFLFIQAWNLYCCITFSLLSDAVAIIAVMSSHKSHCLLN